MRWRTWVIKLICMMYSLVKQLNIRRTCSNGELCVVLFMVLSFINNTAIQKMSWRWHRWPAKGKSINQAACSLGKADSVVLGMNLLCHQVIRQWLLLLRNWDAALNSLPEIYISWHHHQYWYMHFTLRLHLLMFCWCSVCSEMNISFTYETTPL